MECFYCEKLCDFCLKPCLDHNTIQAFSGLGVQTCSKPCSDAVFHRDARINTQNMQDSSEQFAPNGHTEFWRCYSTGESAKSPGLNSVSIFSVCQRKEDDDQFRIPLNMMYIKVWQRSLFKPYCIEYFIDEHFQPVEMLHFEGSESEFSASEEKEMMYQFHEIAGQIGLPYHLAQLEIDTPCTISP